MSSQPTPAPAAPRSAPLPRAPLAGVLPAVLAALLLLGACAPAADEARVEVRQLSAPVSYYPHQTGARWAYLPNDARLSEDPLLVAVEGPTVLDGEVWIAWLLAGRGLEEVSYRQYRPDGVYLKRRLRPGTVIDFAPPIREFPAEGSLRVGATWSGETQVTLSFPEARQENRERVFEVMYTYTVVDQRPVTLASGTFEVFVVALTTRTFDEEGGIAEELTEQIWYAPFVGEVRTDNDFFLVDSNVLGAATTP